MGIEPDLINGRKNRMEKSGSQINQSIGSEKCSRNRWLPLKPVKLDRRVKPQQRQHSPSSSLHLLLNFFLSFFRLLVVVYTKYTLSLSLFLSKVGEDVDSYMLQIQKTLVAKKSIYKIKE